MLLVAKLFGMALRQTGDDGYGGQLWFRREPSLDQRHVWVELRRHSDPLLVTPFRPPMRGTRLTTRELIAELSGECGGRRDRAAHDRGHIAFSSGSLSESASRTTVDAIAEFLLRCADLRQQRHRIERVILLAQPLLGNDQLVHESAVVVEVDTAQKPRE